MKLSDLPIKLPDLPKKVALATAVIVVSIVLFAILWSTLGLSRDAALERVASLTAESARVSSNARQSTEDYDFVVKGKERYEKLIAGDKLVPHSRRDAVTQMLALGREFGMSTVNYSFKGGNAASPTAATSQPKAGDYRVNIEGIEVAIGAPTDGIVYGFLAAMLEDFPGAVVLDRIELARAREITPEALNQVARGRDGGLVTGKMTVTWRTAQKNDEPKK